MIPIDHHGTVVWSEYANETSPAYFADALQCMTRAVEFTDAWANFIVDHGPHEGSCVFESAGVLWHQMFAAHPIVLAELESANGDPEQALRNLMMQTIVGFAELFASWMFHFTQSYAGMQTAGVMDATANETPLDWLEDFKGQFRGAAAKFLIGFRPGPDPIIGVGAHDGHGCCQDTTASAPRHLEDGQS